MAKEELNDNKIMLINDTVNDILLFIDEEYETIKVKNSLWEYAEDDFKEEDMVYPTDLCEEIRTYLTDKLTDTSINLLKGEE